MRWIPAGLAIVSVLAPAMGMAQTTTTTTNVFDVTDTNHDGRISPEEYRARDRKAGGNPAHGLFVLSVDGLPGAVRLPAGRAVDLLALAVDDDRLLEIPIRSGGGIAPISS